MKYKILPGTELFAKLQELLKRMKKANAAGRKLAKQLGGTDFATSGRYLVGGCDAIEFKEPPDKKLWKQVGSSWQKLFAPKANNKEVWNKIQELPVLKYNELNDLVNFTQTGAHSNGSSGLVWVKCVGFEMTKTCALIDVHEEIKSYKPVADMIEITVSEYNQLKGK